MAINSVEVDRGHEIKIRVPYADTDHMGAVYYANYLVYFERGRTELVRSKGLNIRDLESRGVYLPVLDAACKYLSSARYDDLITVSTRIGGLSFASVIFEYEITANEKVLTRGSTRHAFVNKEMKPIRMPADIKAILEKK